MKFKNIKRFSFILTLVLVLTMVAACSPQDSEEPETVEETSNEESVDYPKTVEDGFGNEVTLESAPEKIVSSAPNNTEILFELGLGDKIVGVSTADDYPKEALEKEQIATFEGLNLERVIELETDLVVNFGNMKENAPDDFKRLEEAGIPVLSYTPESIDEVIETIEAIGEATGTEDRAKEITEDMLNKKDEIIEKVKDSEEKTVFYEVWNEPLQTVGPGSFIDEFISLSNGENIAADAEEAYPNYDLESLIEKDPQVYILSDGDPELTVEKIKERPGYSDLQAVKDDNVYMVDANLVSRAGPRIVEGLELIAKTIHPDLFK